MIAFRKLCAAVLALALLFVAPAAASVSVVTNAAASVYSRASSGAEKVSVPAGLKLTLADSRDGWGKVTYKGKTGYIPLKYLNLKSPVKAQLVKSATVYAAAGSDALGTAPRGASVYVLGLDGSYARVTNAGGTQVGYVARSALAEAASVPAGEAKIERAIYAAEGLTGRPYALVANPPESFNCAAFVYYCFSQAQAGCVPGTLRGQVHGEERQKIASISDLKRGDIVCFNFDDAGDIYGHVGIYLGGGRFIHASSSDGEITVSSLTGGYYRNAFSWGRRVFE